MFTETGQLAELKDFGTVSPDILSDVYSVPGDDYFIVFDPNLNVISDAYPNLNVPPLRNLARVITERYRPTSISTGNLLVSFQGGNSMNSRLTNWSKYSWHTDGRV